MNDVLFECLRNLVRIYSEQDDLTAVQKLFSLVESHPELHAKLLEDSRYSYQRSVFYIFQNDLLKAREENVRALSQAVAKTNQADLCNALIQKVKLDLSFGSKRVDVAGDLDKIKTIVQQIGDHDLELISYLLDAEISLAEQDYPQALSSVWKAYEIAKLTSCSFYYLVSSMAMIGYVHLQSGDPEKASTYLHIAEKLIIPEAFVRLGRVINGLQKRSAGKSTQPDLTLDLVRRKLVLSSEDSIDLGNQFVLLDLLKLFFVNPGQVYSKEALTQLVWRQAYDPDIHDNLIYVSLKRLRNLLDKDARVSNLIQRNRNGYYISSTVKTGLLEEERA